MKVMLRFTENEFFEYLHRQLDLAINQNENHSLDLFQVNDMKVSLFIMFVSDDQILVNLTVRNIDNPTVIFEVKKNRSVPWFEKPHIVVGTALQASSYT